MKPAVFLYVLVLMSPFGGVYSISFPGGVDFTFINFLTLFLFPVFLIYCLSRNKFPNLTAIGVLHLVYIMISFLGSVFAINQLAAIRGSIGYVLDTFFCFLYGLAFIRNRSEIDTTVRFFLIAGALSAAMGLIQLGRFALFGEITEVPFAGLFGVRSSTFKNYGYGSGAFSIPGFMRMVGFLGDGFGPYMLIPATLATYAASRESPFRHKTFLKILALVFWTTIFLSVSRSAYLATLVTVIFLYLFKRPSPKAVFPFVFRYYKLVLLVLSIVGFLYFTREASFLDQAEITIDANSKIKTPFFLVKRLNPFVYGSESKSLSYFTEHLDLAIEYSTANLGLGLGNQNFDDYVFERYPVKYGSHSNFIIFLGDNGVWGFLVQILIVATTLGYALRAHYQPRDGHPDPLPLYLGAIFLGQVMTGVVRTFYLTPYALIIGGLIAKLYLLDRREASQAVPISMKTNLPGSSLLDSAT